MAYRCALRRLQNFVPIGEHWNQRLIAYLIFLIFILPFQNNCIAFNEDYPPFDVKAWSDRMLTTSQLNTTDSGEFRDKDLIIGWENVPMESSSIQIRYKNEVVTQIDFPEDDEWSAFLGEIYYSDLDGNGFSDIILQPADFGSGLGAFKKTVTLLFQTTPGQFRRLNFVSFYFEPRDFVDLKGDGRYELLMMQLAQIECADGKLHSFWVYAPYEIKDFSLVMDSTLHDYPRFIWYTEKPNSKATDKLSIQQKDDFIKTLPAVIRSEAI